MAPKNPPQAAEHDEAEDPSFQVTPEVLQQLMASGNPQLVAALQRGLSRMVGASSGYIESLPKAVQRRIDYVRSVEEERNELEEQFLRERRALEEKYAKLYEPLYAKRSAIVNGETDIPENESEDAKKEAREEAGPNGEIPAGIPEFWAGALRNHPLLAEQITEKDNEVLAFLTDIKVETLRGWEKKEGAEEEEEEEEPEEGFRLVFSFKPNPFFANDKLTKTYLLDVEDGETMLSRIEGCDIQWNAGKDVTVKVLKKKPKPGAKAAAKPQTKLEPVESFFHWFKAPETPADDAELEDEELEALQEDMHGDYEMAEAIRGQIVPHALEWFTGEALQDEDDDEDDDEDEEDDEDDEDEDDDEEDEDEDSEDEGDAKDSKRMAGAQKKGPSDAAAQPQECKQQ